MQLIVHVHICSVSLPTELVDFNIVIQWSLYFKTTHGTKKLCSYIAGGPKIKVNLTQKIALWDQNQVSYYQGWS